MWMQCGSLFTFHLHFAMIPSSFVIKLITSQSFLRLQSLQGIRDIVGTTKVLIPQEWKCILDLSMESLSVVKNKD
jgi:hypothetical protein